MDVASSGIVRRRLEAVVKQRLREEPVIALHGPRTVGKSTLLEAVAGNAGVRRIDLDDQFLRASVAEDPPAYVRGTPPVCIDEYQHVPELLSAIKAELNRGLSPGRYILTGSTTYSSIPLTAQSLTGRLHLITVWPLSQGEIDGLEESFVAQLFEKPDGLISRAPSNTTRDEYESRILRGGMPVVLGRVEGRGRNRWFDDYVKLVTERDVMELSKVRQREALPRLLSSIAAQAGQVLVVGNAARSSNLEPSTAESYTQLLEAAFMIHRLPAWGVTLGSRQGRRPKVHMVDTGLGARLMGLTAQRLAGRDPVALTEFGHVLENFVVNEVLKQASWEDQRISAGHFRTREGVEVDLVLENDEGKVVGLEVKAAGGATGKDFAGLRRLRENVGDRFQAGFVLHLGEHSFRHEPDLIALPVDRLWMG